MPLKPGSKSMTVGKSTKELGKSLKMSGITSPKKNKLIPKIKAKANKMKKETNKKVVSENFFLLGFIKSLVEKNYKDADKYLQGQVDSVVTKKIETAVKKQGDKI